jgi:hypothetical protein
MKSRILLPLVLLTLFCGMQSLAQEVAPDASPVGPLTVATGEYDLGAMMDPMVLPGCSPSTGYDCKIDIRAKVYYPHSLAGKYPLVIFLHGNHGTCGHPDPSLPGDPRLDDNSTYTGTGTCPSGYIESPSYQGYGYLANRLASYGYIIASIDANRGITAGPGLPGDFGLIKARGELVLRHLQNLSHWNRHGGTPAGVGVELMGHLDFSNIGLMGHSRGGDGMRAAYNFYIVSGSPWPSMIEDPVVFAGIYEIAPVDFLGNNSKGVVWHIIAGMCDGDVSDIEGIRPYDRDILPPFETTPRQKSSTMIWGANHDFFNSQWQISDASSFSPPYPSDCTGSGNKSLFTISPGSLQQRLTTMSSLLAFFRGNVGASKTTTFNRNFNPYWGIPAHVTDETGTVQPYPTRADRGFTPPVPIKVFEDFTGKTGTSSYGFPNLASGVTINHGPVPNHDPSLRAGQITWSAAGLNTYFQTNWTAAGSGRAISAYTTLEIRVSRQNRTLNPSTPTNFSVQIIGTTATSGMVLLSYFWDPNFVGTTGHRSTLAGPVGSSVGGPHPILQTVRIPLTRFPSLAAVQKQVHGVRLIFNKTTTGAIYVANIRLSNAPVTTAPTLDAEDLLEEVSQIHQMTPRPIIPHAATIVALRPEFSLPQYPQKSGVEIEIVSPDRFPAKDSLLTLRIGAKYFALSRYGSHDLHQVVFTLTDAEFASIKPGDLVTVQYGFTQAGHVWYCGTLN